MDRADEFKIEQGREIGKLARLIYPEGILIEEKDMVRAARITESLMGSPDGTVLYEAAFCCGSYRARADILHKKNGCWNLVEVKSSIRDKALFIADLAYTSMVMEMCGYAAQDRILWLLSREYTIDQNVENLFQAVDHTKPVRLRTGEFLRSAPWIEQMLLDTDRPEAPFGPSCKKCEYSSNCFDFPVHEHIISLPFLSRKVYDKLIDKGISMIRDLPEQMELTPHQEMMKRSLLENRTIVSSELESMLECIEWPAFYLDFETTMTAIPLFPDTLPYQQIVTQYSVHICSEIGEVTDHREFLAETDRDCRKDLAEKLIHDLKGSGSIVVYSGFEQSTIGKLASLFPELTESLKALVPRLVDLEKIIKNGIYHPEFKGRTSIKKTLPALVPDMHYDDLSIGNGSSALAAYAGMARGDIPDEQIPGLRKDLLDYCARDTLAMVKLHEALFRAVEKEKKNGL